MGIEKLLRRGEGTATGVSYGKVIGCRGAALHASLPDPRPGELVRIHPQNAPGSVLAEVAAGDLERVTLLPLERGPQLGVGDLVERLGTRLSFPMSKACLGRVLDGAGQSIDGLGPLNGDDWSAHRSPPHPLERPRIEEIFVTGIRAIDAFATLGRGQRIGLFAGSGVGKTTLLRQIARQAEADVVVLCLVGERSRELRYFVDELLRPPGVSPNAKAASTGPPSLIVSSTIDDPPLARVRSVSVATAAAEYFRDQGENVLLLVDSLSRLARAGREVGLARGELPARRGYPASVFSMIPQVVERAGCSRTGSITALYTVLVEGDDLSEPVADEVRAALDGHIVLSREIAERDRWPAIDLAKSVSRLMPDIAEPRHLEAASLLQRAMATYEAKRSLLDMGAYAPGSDPIFDRACRVIEAFTGFLGQRSDERSPWSQTLKELMGLAQDCLGPDASTSPPLT